MARLERFKVLDPAWRNQALSRVRGLLRRHDDGGPESTTMPKGPVSATAATQPPAADNTSSPRSTLLAGAAETELRRGEMRSRFDGRV